MDCISNAAIPYVFDSNVQSLFQFSPSLFSRCSALPTARPRSTESANSSERCPSHDSNSSDNGGQRDAGNMSGGVLPVVPTTMHSTFPAVPQSLPAQPSSMEAYLHMVAAAAQQYGFPLAAAAAAGPRLPLPLPSEAAAPFKLPPQASPTASSSNSEALDFRTNLYARAESAEPVASEEEEEFDDGANNPLDLSVGTRKRSHDAESPVGQIQVKKMFKSDSPPANASPVAAAAPLMPGVNPYLAAVAAANIFRAGQFPDWNGKNDLVVDPLEKMSDIVKGGAGGGGSSGLHKEKQQSKATPPAAVAPPPKSPANQTGSGSGNGSGSSGSNNTAGEGGGGGGSGVTKARHNIWQSHWQNKGVASSVFRCVWCKQSFPTLEALTTHMKDSKHCGVNVPPFGNLPSNQPHHHSTAAPPPQQQQQQRKQSGSQAPSANVKNAFQYRGDPPTPLPRKLVRGQNVWLGKGVEQAMQILKCMRCGESFRSLGEMTKHMQETQHYTNILSQEQSISIKSGNASNDHGKDSGQNSLSSEESRTLSAVLTCKVCDKAFSSLGDLSNHMAKNNHYAEPLLQSAGARKRPAPKKREKSLPVRKLLELKANPEEQPLEKPKPEKSEAALFAERMRQYITGVKSPEEIAKAAQLLAKNKSPELEQKNGGANAGNAGSGAGTGSGKAGSSSVLSAIEQMFTTSFDTPPRHASLPASSPSNSSTKNTSPVASSILKRLGIDETVDYNKPLIDTSDPYYQHYRYTSSERSGSECSAEARPRLEAPTPEKQQPSQQQQQQSTSTSQSQSQSQSQSVEVPIKQEPESSLKMEIKSELSDEPQDLAAASPKIEAETPLLNGNYNNNNNNSSSSNNNNNNNGNSPKSSSAAGSPQSSRLPLPPRSPADSQRSATPKSPASSHKSYDGSDSNAKKYPSDSLNALSSMFDSLGSSGAGGGSGAANTRAKLAAAAAAAAAVQAGGDASAPENLSASNSLAALRQFCVKKEKTA
ncbi:PREDICTED: protein teashirt [Drosophila arizonae]|uniref:Protein teashirt n=1 Tax=Drosophila arizonae TaxID=7263 RepID=A0ABM1NPB3_DROAR|nr:PREDICTED: protein teashirt [Drosophila arizonae]